MTTDHEFLAALDLKMDEPAPQVDPHTIPASSIVFDEHLLDGFPDLSWKGGMRSAAVSHVFQQYKSPKSATSTDRNSLLYRLAGEFVARVDKARQEPKDDHVKEKVRSTKKQRDLLAALEAQGITSLDDLAVALPQEESDHA